jgi:hypothetical protein
MIELAKRLRDAMESVANVTHLNREALEYFLERSTLLIEEDFREGLEEILEALDEWKKASDAFIAGA